MAQGYLAEDGTFFESQQEAQLYEAETWLREAFEKRHPTGDVAVFMAIVTGLQVELRRYLNAYQPPSFHESDHAEVSDREAVDANAPTKANDSSGYVTGTEEDIKGVLKLPTRRLSHVPDVRGSPHAKAIPDGGEIDGA